MKAAEQDVSLHSVNFLDNAMRDLGTRLTYACGIILTRELRHLLGIYLRISSSAIRGYAITEIYQYKRNVYSEIASVRIYSGYGCVTESMNAGNFALNAEGSLRFGKVNTSFSVKHVLYDHTEGSLKCH